MEIQPQPKARPMTRPTEYTPADFLRAVIDPGLALLPPKLTTPEARVLLLAIAKQESGLRHVRQMGGGPARGPWQFEPIGLAEVQRHPASRDLFRVVLRTRPVAAFLDPFEWLAEDSQYAAAVARLALVRDPRPLPAIGAERAAWGYYEDIWRPGRPRPESWSGCYAEAVEAVL